MPLIGVDLTSLPAEVREILKEEFSHGHQQAVVDAMARQAVIARHYYENPPAWDDTMGPLTMSIDPVLLNCMRWAMGEEGFQEEGMAWLRKKYEALRVKAVSPKTQVGYRSAPATACGRDASAAACASQTRGKRSSIVLCGEGGRGEVKFRKSYN
jgi:hypothetical protein